MDTSFQIGSGFDRGVSVIVPDLDNNILVGGAFITYKNNNQSAHLIKLKATNPLSIESYNNILEDVFVYPNPTSNYVNIGDLKDIIIQNLSVYNLQNQFLFETDDDKIDISSLPSGIYFIKVKTNNGEIIKKVAKK
jgi:hypothetical protein